MPALKRFYPMNHKLHYDALIDRSRNRILEGYVERHHILPQCMGGGNDPENLVDLTPEEHYVAHQLLIHMHPGDSKLIYAAKMMTISGPQNQRNNKLYGWLRRRFSETMKQQPKRKHSEETRAKMREACKTKIRKPHTEETKAKMSAAHKGKKKSKQHCENISKAKTGKKLGPRPPEVIARVREAMLKTLPFRDNQSYRTAKYREKQSNSQKRAWKRRKLALIQEK